MKKMNGCAVKNGVIELTKAFAKNAYTPGTAEFRYLADLHKAFPDFPIVQRTANVSEDKEKHGGLTIKWMTDFIKNYKDEVAVAEFEEVKKFFKTILHRKRRSSCSNGNLRAEHLRVDVAARACRQVRTRWHLLYQD